MENNELRDDNAFSRAKDSQIQLVVNSQGDDEDTIDLGHVFHNMKLKSRLFAWVLILCMMVGICTPLLLYQFTKAPLTVASVVTLDYEVVSRDSRTGVVRSRRQVTDLTAPDDTPLDLEQVTSSYVLQNALSGLTLSQPITLSNLRGNITIQRRLTDGSLRQQEMVSSMLEAKSSQAYEEAANLTLNYSNQFVVSLSNGFGDEDSRVKLELRDDELRTLLDRVLASYNEYLVKTYADKTLPNDALSLISIDELDIPESVSQMTAAMEELYSYCDEQPDAIKAYRSWQTGESLTDYMNRIRVMLDTDVRYFASYAYANGIAEDRNEAVVNEQYRLTTTQTQLDEVNENVSATMRLLDTYKNDEILVTSSDAENTQTAVVNTATYNTLLLQVSDYYSQAADLENQMSDIQSHIDSLNKSNRTIDPEEAAEELEGSLQKVKDLYASVRSHMEEIMDSTFYNTYAQHSEPLGKQPNFLTASAKRIIIGLVAGVVIGCGLWFLAALAPEFSRRKEEEKEAAEA